MGYDIYINSEKVGMGLSEGELNQWLLETLPELSKDEQKIFKEDFGFTDGNFEDFLYNNEHELPLTLRFGEVYMVIDNTVFE